jgi:hypothetical protein
MAVLFRGGAMYPIVDAHWISSGMPLAVRNLKTTSVVSSEAGST